MAAITWNPATLDSFDTAESIWQKLNQLGWQAGGVGPGPQMQDGIATFQSSDGTWHLVDLQDEGELVTTRVDQANQADPGAPYIGYAVLLADDGTRHKVMLELDGGYHTLRVFQETTEEALSEDIILAAASGYYLLSVVLDGGYYTLSVGPTEEVAPPIVGGQQYLQSDDDSWHLVDLEIVNGVNVARVDQTDAASPGGQYLGYVVLIADDATRHELGLVNYGGTHVLRLKQETTPAAGVSGISLESSDSNLYVVSAVLYGGSYEMQIEQP